MRIWLQLSYEHVLPRLVHTQIYVWDNANNKCGIIRESCTIGSWLVVLCYIVLLLQDYRFNTLRPRQNGRHFADDIFKCIFLNENVWIPIKFSLKFDPKGPINYIPAFVQIMAWRRPGDKPLSETMMVRLLTHICVTRPQWVNQIPHVYLFHRHWNSYTISSIPVWGMDIKCDIFNFFIGDDYLILLYCIGYHAFTSKMSFYYSR